MRNGGSIIGFTPTNQRRISPIEFLEELDTPAWMSQGLCAQTDPEAFYPEKGGSSREAKATCGRCGVRDDCLTYALDHEERFGIWGGASERERRKLKKRKAAADQ